MFNEDDAMLQLSQIDGERIFNEDDFKEILFTFFIYFNGFAIAPQVPQCYN